MSAISFLNFPLKVAFVIPAIVICWTILIGGPVTEMPFGLQEPLQFIADAIATIVHVMPWMDPIVTIFIMGIQVKIMFIIVSVIQWIVSIFVQN